MVQKKMRAISLLLFIVILIGAFAGCSDSKPAPVNEGAIYVTGKQSFWAGVGNAYISFEHKSKSSSQSSSSGNEIDGDVFYVNVSSGKEYSTWLTGTWNLEKTGDKFGNLTLTTTWDDKAKNPTKLSDAKSGVAKVYKPVNGKYDISVALPSATVTFTLDPVANKVEQTSK